VGDVIEAGIDIANSEVGLRSVQVTPITYRLVCTNGMRAWRSEAALRMRHVGDPNRLHEQLRDAVPIAFAEARGDIARWQRATEVLVDNALEEVESLRLLGLSSGEVQAVGRELAVSAGRLLAESSGAETVAADHGVRGRERDHGGRARSRVDRLAPHVGGSGTPLPVAPRGLIRPTGDAERARARSFASMRASRAGPHGESNAVAASFAKTVVIPPIRK
jgi:hypothetical protein